MNEINDEIYQVSFQRILEISTIETLKFLAAEQDYMLDNVLRDDVALELGCGTGRLLKVLAGHVGHITGLDYSSVQLDEAARNTARHRDKITLVQGDARDPPLFGQYDSILITYNTINSLNDPSEESKLEVLSHANQLLVPDGRLIVTTWAENALDVQLEHYALIGFPHVVETTDEYVQVRNDAGVEIRCGRSSPQKLQDLLEKTGFKGSIERLTDYSYACFATKS